MLKGRRRTAGSLARFAVVAGLIAVASPAFAESDPVGFDLEAALSQGTRSMSADQVARLATESAPSVDRARAAVAVAQAGARTTWVAFIPRVDVSARYARIGGFEDGVISLGNDQIPTEQALLVAESVQDPAAQMLLTGMIEQLSNIGEISFATPRNQTGFRAGLAVPVTDLFLTVLPAYRAGEARTRLEEARLEASENEVALAAVEAFYRYAQARGALAVAEEALRLAEDHRDQMAAIVTAGLGAEADRLDAEARVASFRSTVARARGGVVMARVALLTLLHTDDQDGEIAIGESIVTPISSPPPVTEELLRAALENRPESRALEELFEVQQQSARAARGGHSPRLALFAGAEVSNPNQRVIPPDDEFTPSWEVGVALSWSPSDSMSANLRTRAAEAQQEVVEAEMEQLRDAVRLQVIRAREDQVAALAVMDAASERVRAALAAHEARTVELRAGEAVSTELSVAELEVTRARLELLNAAVEQRVARARFRYALGEGSSEEVGDGVDH